MKKTYRILLFLGLFLWTGFLAQAQTATLSVTVTGAIHQSFTFQTGVVSRQLIAYQAVPPEHTLGFFTDRNENIPFYFAGVLADLQQPVAAGDFPMLPVVNDMPELSTATLKGALLTLKINNPGIARPEEYISIPGTGNLIQIQDISSSEIKGTFSSQMQSVSDASRQIQVSGSFVLSR